MYLTTLKVHNMCQCEGIVHVLILSIVGHCNLDSLCLIYVFMHYTCAHVLKSILWFTIQRPILTINKS